jgi:hypothetical protein
VHGLAGSPARMTMVGGQVRVRDGVLVGAQETMIDWHRYDTLTARLREARRLS